ncbi:ABC transporter permease [Chlorobaculum sp. 24CR]|uniref:ABC transporter permease n=1 Tax=Chlorobaculum sp. 24CR TaxID=2508878 RepID=UPI00100B76BB|nr:ABC transporter permease [Chlorobaculum sp. 24CR]RXK80654.1 ABC transporter permease [Chlorobaculum sp. 24CR]
MKDRIQKIKASLAVVGYLLQKEFLQIFRNKGMLPIIFIMPFIQLIILSNAATFDVPEVPFHLQDFDRTALSDRLVKRFTSTGYFRMTGESFRQSSAIEVLSGSEAKMVLVIPNDFEREMMTTGHARVQLLIDAEDGFTAGVIQGYANDIVVAFNRDLPELLPQLAGAQAVRPVIEMRPRGWYNPELVYIDYMVPGVLVVLVTLIGLFLSGMNVVREREIGTIDQINVTPIKRWQFITGKLLPFWIIALGELTVGLVIARLGFHVPMLGHYYVIYLVAAIYLLVVLGMGLLISTVTESQQQAMFVAWFFIVIFILLSGLFTPIQSMPHWAQNLTLANPVRHFVDIMRRVMLKGSDFGDIAAPFGILGVEAVVMLTLAANLYRKVSA